MAEPELKAVSKSAHSEKYWRRASDYEFTGQDVYCPLALQELPRALMGVPMGFTIVGEQLKLVAVLGLEPDRNLFVGDSGRWLGRYIPAWYRCYPFVTVQGEDNQLILCVDESSGMISTSSQEGAPFFDENEKPNEKLLQIGESLQQNWQGRIAANEICRLLNEAGVLEAWPIVVQKEGEEKPKAINGFFRVSEEKLNTLSTLAFSKLRNAGALPVAYGQLFSMAHMPSLVQLADQKNSNLSVDELDFGEFDQGGSISFENL